MLSPTYGTSFPLIFFSEIDGFNDLARTCTPLDLFEMLDFHLCFYLSLYLYLYFYI